MKKNPCKEKEYRMNIQLFMTLFLPFVIIGGYFYPLIGFTIVAMIMLFMTLANKRGRMYCGWLCPMGAFHERFLSEISLHKTISPMFRTTWFRWFVFITMMGFMTCRLTLAWGDAEAIGSVFQMMWTVSMTLAIALGVYFKARTWCVICPMGSLQGIFSKNTFRLHVAGDCVECGKCKQVCPISTYPGEFRNDTGDGEVPSIECLRCYNCVENCPKGSLLFK